MKKFVLVMALFLFISPTFADEANKASSYFMIGEGVVGCAVIGGATSLIFLSPLGLIVYGVYSLIHKDVESKI